MYLKTSYTVLFIFYNFLLFGQGIQDIKFQSLNVNDGLPNNIIHDIQTDSQGFLWIATNEGLCRYDSPNNIKVFEKESFGLTSNQIKSICFSDDNYIWVGSTKSGLSRYNLIDETYENFTVENSELSHNDIISLSKDENSNLWIGTEDGLNIYNQKSKEWNIYTSEVDTPYALQGKAILSVYTDNKGWKWIGSWEGGFYLVLDSKTGDTSSLKFRKFLPSSDSNASNVWRIFQDSKDRYWVATHNAGLFLMQLPENSSDKYGEQDWEPTFHNYQGTLKDETNLSSNYVYDISEDDNGNLWMACIHGLNVLSKDQLEKVSTIPNATKKPKLKFTNILYDKNLKGSINSSNLHKIYKDSNNMMWFGSSSGLNMFSTKASQFQELDLNRYGKGFPNSNVSALAADKNGNVWLGTEANGLLFYNKSENTVVSATKNINTEIPNQIYSLKLVGDSLLLGYDIGLGILNTKTNVFTRHDIPEQYLQNRVNTFNRNILIDSKKRVWLGSEYGIILFREDFSKIDYFKKISGDPTSISDNSITEIFEDQNQEIWIATYRGLNKLVEEDGKLYFKHIINDNTKTDYIIPTKTIRSICEFENNLYFGSESGLFSHDLKTEKFMPIESINRNNNIFNIDITSDGQLWAVNSDGLLKYDIKSQSVSYYEKDEELGDLGNQLNSSFLTEDDDILFSLRNGFVVYNNNEKGDQNNGSPPVFLTEVYMLGQKKEYSENLIHKDQIDILPSVYHLSFKYAALSYNHPRDNLYAYKLEGFEDDEWNYLNVNSPIVFTNLEPGNYTLTVKAANSDGIWNEEGDSITIRVIPAIYETVLFKILSVLFLIGLIYFGFKYYVRNILMRNEQLSQEISDRKMAESALLERDIKMKVLLSELDKSNSDLERSNRDLEQFAYIASHDLKEPLRTVGTFTDLLKHKFESNLNESGKKYIYFITDGVHRMSSLINSLLTYSRSGEEFKEMQDTDLNDLIIGVLNDLSKVIQEKNVTFEIAQLPSIFCNPDQISMLFSNFIRNGIKFNKSKNNHINIHFKELKDYWQFSVKDNGIGIEEEYQQQIFEIFKRLHSKEEYEGTGIGLALCKRIVENHGGGIWLESTPGQGSEFHFTIAKVIETISADERKEKKKKLKADIESLLNS